MTTPPPSAQQGEPHQGEPQPSVVHTELHQATPLEAISAMALLIDELDQRGEDAWDLDARLEEIERVLIREALDRCNGNRTETAKFLKLSFRSMRYRLKKLDVEES